MMPGGGALPAAELLGSHRRPQPLPQIAVCVCLLGEDSAQHTAHSLCPCCRLRRGVWAAVGSPQRCVPKGLLSIDLGVSAFLLVWKALCLAKGPWCRLPRAGTASHKGIVL